MGNLFAPDLEQQDVIIGECIKKSERDLRSMTRKHDKEMEKLKTSKNQVHDAEIIAMLRWQIQSTKIQIKDYMTLQTHIQQTHAMQTFTNTVAEVSSVLMDVPETTVNYQDEIQKLRNKYSAIQLISTQDKAEISVEVEKVPCVTTYANAPDSRRSGCATYGITICTIQSHGSRQFRGAL
jgi:hypothetical protein